MIFVRHGRAVVQPDVPTHEWPLDAAHIGAIAELRTVLPELPVVCSDMRRAIETARFFGEPTVDPRLAEVSRPWTNDDLEASITRYFLGEPLDGWEPQADARARIEAEVGEYGRAIYVTHGTVLSLSLSSIVPALNAMRFWTDLTNPDAWQVDGDRLVRLSPGD